MSRYDTLSNATQGFFGVFALLLMAGAVYLLVSVCSMRRRDWRLAFSVLLTAIAVLLLQGIGDVSNCKVNGFTPVNLGKMTGAMPYGVLAALLTLMASAEAALLQHLRQQRKTMLTSMSAKESLDALPDGICFFHADGQPLLVNMRMNRISAELFGTTLLNADAFLQSLRRGEEKAEFLRTEPTVIVRTEDGKVWDFRVRTLTVRRAAVQELIAYDVTEQQHLGEELDARNAALKRVNERLRRYSREVERSTMEKELLTAKMRVHDDVGRSLLAFRAYLEQPKAERNRNALLLLWRQTVAVLKNEASPVKRCSDWELLSKAAQSVDVQIVQDGEVPENDRERAVIIAAVHECLTNTVKHAKGNKLYLKLCSNETVLTATLTNNGIPPTGAICETGGLLNLRNTVETAGGTMKTEATPRFLLRIELPKGVC